jgi:protein-S-isoprenylcysteine O-methyltransferase Ste14
VIDPDWLRAGLLLAPGALVAILWVSLRPDQRVMTGALLAFLWNVALLLAANFLAFAFGWWRFVVDERTLHGMPVDVLVGWALWWGAVPALALGRVPLALLVLAFAWIDVLFMPRLQPLIVLGDHWLAGEAVALALCLVPGLWLARDTAAASNLARRASLQGIGYGAWLLVVIPAAITAYAGEGAAAARDTALSSAWMIVPLGLLLLIGLAALHEFAAVGHGTPIPFDSPQRLVASGPYAYLANPMQAVSIGVMVLLAAWLRRWEFLAVAASFLIYSLGFVRWHHRADIAVRFGRDWDDYRASVPNWLPRWRPYLRQAATLTVPASGAARRLAACIERLRPTGLTVVTGAEGPAYRTGGGIEADGVTALARALEHTNLALAMPAWIVRLPGMAQSAQWLIDRRPDRGS